MLAANTFTGFLIRGGMGANETQSDWCLANIRIVVQCRVTDLRPCTLRPFIPLLERWVLSEPNLGLTAE